MQVYHVSIMQRDTANPVVELRAPWKETEGNMAADRTGSKTGSKKFALTSGYQLATLTVVLCKRLQYESTYMARA